MVHIGAAITALEACAGSFQRIPEEVRMLITFGCLAHRLKRFIVSNSH